MFAETENVVTVKLADVCTAGTVATGCTWAAERPLVERVTDAPPVGAGALKNTVPITLLPPTTVVVLSVIEDSNGGASGSGPRFRNTDFVIPPALASIRTVVAVRTGAVVIVKLSALFPAVMETVAGT